MQDSDVRLRQKCFRIMAEKHYRPPGDGTLVMVNREEMTDSQRPYSVPGCSYLLGEYEKSVLIEVAYRRVYSSYSVEGSFPFVVEKLLRCFGTQTPILIPKALKHFATFLAMYPVTRWDLNDEDFVLHAI